VKRKRKEEISAREKDNVKVKEMRVFLSSIRGEEIDEEK